MRGMEGSLIINAKRNLNLENLCLLKQIADFVIVLKYFLRKLWQKQQYVPLNDFSFLVPNIPDHQLWLSQLLIFEN